MSNEDIAFGTVMGAILATVATTLAFSVPDNKITECEQDKEILTKKVHKLEAGR